VEAPSSVCILRIPQEGQANALRERGLEISSHRIRS
jgi:hypothetical protein